MKILWSRILTFMNITLHNTYFYNFISLNIVSFLIGLKAQIMKSPSFDDFKYWPKKKIKANNPTSTTEIYLNGIKFQIFWIELPQFTRLRWKEKKRLLLSVINRPHTSTRVIKFPSKQFGFVKECSSYLRAFQRWRKWIMIFMQPSGKWRKKFEIPQYKGIHRNRIVWVWDEIQIVLKE